MRASRVGLAAAVVVVAVLVFGLVVPVAGPVAARQATPAAAEEAAGDEAIEITGLVERPGPLRVADLQQLPNQTVEATYESGDRMQSHSFTGTRLFAVLEHAGLAVDADERNPLLRRYLIVTAKDGYQIVLSGGELDPNLGNAPMLLTWEQDGQPLSGEDGPARLVVPGDKRGGRYVYGIVRIDVLSIDGQPPAA
jgi:DMSO/TMAO reductase YedYZ molybdopterin-dependent catalytic subunit